MLFIFPLTAAALYIVYRTWGKKQTKNRRLGIKAIFKKIKSEEIVFKNTNSSV